MNAWILPGLVLIILGYLAVCAWLIYARESQPSHKPRTGRRGAGD